MLKGEIKDFGEILAEQYFRSLKCGKLKSEIYSLDDNFIVLQIYVDYPNVQVALFQVTWILRERVFNASLPKDCLPFRPHKLLNMTTQGNKSSVLTCKMNNFRVSKETNGFRPPLLPHSQFSTGSNPTTRTVSLGNSAVAEGDSCLKKKLKLKGGTTESITLGTKAICKD